MKKLVLISVLSFILFNLNNLNIYAVNFGSCVRDINKVTGRYTYDCYLKPEVLSVANTWIGDRYKIKVKLSLPNYVEDVVNITECEESWFVINNCTSRTKSISALLQLHWNYKSTYSFYTKTNISNEQRDLNLYESSLNKTFTLRYRIGSADYKLGRMVFPIQGDYKITQNFGKTVYSDFHTGIDISAKNKQVLSIASGKVVYAGKDIFSDKCNNGGKIIKIRHNNNIYSLYVHLSKILVKDNDTVKAGDVIGMIGNSGSNNCLPIKEHLHFEIRKSINSYDVINPLSIFN